MRHNLAISMFFSDGSRTQHDYAAVADVRNLSCSITGFRTVSLITREQNLGLSRSLIDGVTKICREHGRVIVLEDDILVGRYFLRFMNDGLNQYAEDDRVAAIHGYIYPVMDPLPRTFFLRGADCWGWATWNRAWKTFEPNGKALLRALRAEGLISRFNMDGSFPYTRMLERQVAGRNDSWAIRWHASAFLAGQMTLYPGCSLVQNIGLDGSGTHCKFSSMLPSEISSMPVPIVVQSVSESDQARMALVNYFRASRLSIMRQVVSVLRSSLQFQKTC